MTLHLYATDHGHALALKFATLLQASSMSVLESPWVVTTSTAMRSRLDWDLASPELAKLSPSLRRVSSNLTSFFPEQLVSHVEGLALEARGLTRIDWRLETIALALIQESSGSLSWNEATVIAGQLDEFVRWRSDADVPEVLERAKGLMNSQLWRTSGPLAQRQCAVDAISKGEVALPSDIYIVGMTMAPGGRSFIDLLVALGEVVNVHVLLSLPSLSLLDSSSDTDDGSIGAVSWARDAKEALELWREACGEPLRVNRSDYGIPISNNSLVSVQKSLVTGGRAGLADDSFQIVGAYGPSRQVEVARDFILSALNEEKEGASQLEPHEILVTSPRLEDFANSIARHWDYPRTSEPTPRLPFEIIETPVSALDDRAHFLEAVLSLVGNYVLTDQVERCLNYNCLRQAYSLSESDIGRLLTVVDEANVTFGIDEDHRATFNLLSPGKDDGTGTWQRLLDRLALTAMLPDDNDDPDQLGVATDVSLAEPVFALLTALRKLNEKKEGDERATVASWMTEFGAVLNVIVSGDSRGDMSFERMAQKLDEWSRSLGDPLLTLTDVMGIWRHMTQSGVQSNLFGGRGVHVAPLTAMPAATYRMVVVLGCDEERMPASTLRSAILVDVRSGDPNPRRSVLGALLQNICAASERVVVLYNSRNELTGEVVKPPMVVAELLEHLDGGENLVRHTARHAFARTTAATVTVPTYDTRAARLAQSLLTNTAAKPSIGRVVRAGATAYAAKQRTEATDGDEGSLSVRDLLGFAKSAPKRFIEVGLKATTVPDPESTAHFPVLDLQTLEAYAVVDELYERSFATFGLVDSIDEVLVKAWLEEILDRESVSRHIPGELRTPVEIDLFICAFETLRICRRDFHELNEADLVSWPATLEVGGVSIDTRVPDAWTVYRGYSKFHGDAPQAPLSTFRYEKMRKSTKPRERDLVAMMVEALLLRLIGEAESEAPVAMTFNPPEKSTGFQEMTGVRFIGSQESARDLLERFIHLFQINKTTPLALTREFSAWSFRSSGGSVLSSALSSDLKHNGLRTLFPENVEDFEVVMGEQGISQWLNDAATDFEFASETAKDHKKRDAALRWRPMLEPESATNESDDE